MGVTTHSGWAIAVVAGLDAGRLEVVDRRRIELISPDLPRQAYHAALGLPAEEAEALVTAVDRSIVECSLAALRKIQADHTVVAVAVVGPIREIPDVPKVLASHARMHASEGEQYRRGVTEAAADLGLRVERVDPKDLPSGLAEDHARIRATLGPPWQKDHKDATAAALAALG